MGKYKLTYNNGMLTHKIWHGANLPKNDKPTELGYNAHGDICYKRWHTSNRLLHRLNAPAIIFYDDESKDIIMEYWMVNNKSHRLDGPAILQWVNGKLIRKEWYIYGQRIDEIKHKHWPLTIDQIVEIKLKYT